MKSTLSSGLLGVLFLLAADLAFSQTQEQVYKPDLPAGIGNANERLASFRIKAASRTETLQAVTMNLEGTTDLADLSTIKVYYNGPVERFNPEDATLFGSAESAAGVLTITGNQPLTEGENYLWITANVSARAREGHQIGANPLSFTKIGGQPVSIPALEGTRTLLQTSTLLFSGGDAGSENYRIPAIVTALDGSLVTATDKRWENAADLPNHIDVVIRRSTDQGRSWSEPLTIAGQGTSVGYGDPALVVNRQNGDIICLFASDKGWTQSTATDPQRINVSISSDNGITWSAPVDITSQIYGAECDNPISKNWPGAFVTSGAGTQLRSGRLMAVLAARETTANVISNFVIYSDDGARTWQVSTNRASINGDEAKVVELDNGDVLMSIRHSGNRWFNISKDQGITWLESPYSQPDIVDPFCNGDLIRYTSKTTGYDKNRLLHSIPYAASRKNVSVLISYDEGDTWPVRRTICPGASAYSSLCVLDDGNGTIGIYVEVGEYETYQMYFISFSLDWLSSATDRWVTADN
ncbi:MAG: exo-alpha-sialidase [Bacteroidales bacterium]